MSNFPLFYLIPGLGQYLVLAAWICLAIIHVAFAIGVLKDSYRMHSHDNGTFLVGGSIWALATLFGGVITAGIYWVIHHSALRPKPPVPEKPV